MQVVVYGRPHFARSLRVPDRLRRTHPSNSIEPSRSAVFTLLGSCTSNFVVDGELVGTASGGSDGLELCDAGGPGGRAARGGLVNTSSPRIRILLPLHGSPILLQAGQPHEV